MTRRDLLNAISPDRHGSDAWQWDPEQLSRSEGRQVIDVVFDEIILALLRGEKVEVPIGTFEVRNQTRKPVRNWFLRRVRVTYAKPKVVHFEVDPSIIGGAPITPPPQPKKIGSRSQNPPKGRSPKARRGSPGSRQSSK
jgi:nucleoid DNA-binding protein